MKVDLVRYHLIIQFSPFCHFPLIMQSKACCLLENKYFGPTPVRKTWVPEPLFFSPLVFDTVYKTGIFLDLEVFWGEFHVAFLLASFVPVQEKRLSLPLRGGAQELQSAFPSQPASHPPDTPLQMHPLSPLHPGGEGPGPAGDQMENAFQEEE